MTPVAIHPTLSSEPLQLHCLVLGESRNRIFAVEIAATKSVGALKKVTKHKKMHAFEHVDADTLVLWKVAIPVDQDLQENLDKFQIIDTDALSPVDPLSIVFSALPTVRYLHVVVRFPSSSQSQSLFVVNGIDALPSSATIQEASPLCVQSSSHRRSWSTSFSISVVQVLSTTLPFHFHHSDTKFRTMAARHLGAFKKTIRSLEHHYEDDLPAINMSNPPLPLGQIFPHPTHFTSLINSTPQRFEYLSQPMDDKLVFFGKLSDNRDICIKFVRHHSHEVHSFCASTKAAPELLGLERIAGGWHMVVMGLIGGDYVELHQLSGTPQLLDKIRDTLSRLHQAGYVHSYIRDTNIMVAKNAEPSFMLVDFDWAGKLGEVRYAMNVHQGEDLWRPNGASDGELITADHDMQMMEYMFH